MAALLFLSTTSLVFLFSFFLFCQFLCHVWVGLFTFFFATFFGCPWFSYLSVFGFGC
ncbi:hypothetical protein C8J56DRAFT_941175 [Mycena floridula]|nr:hypothetical protein C8J56DRAFT_941175 [Mycena floridula]